MNSFQYKNRNVVPFKSFNGIVRLFLLVFFSLLFTSSTFTEEANIRVPIGINEHLGEVVNLDYTFVDEKGNTFSLVELVDRPTILNFVYYNCPGICTPLLAGLQDVIDRVDMEPGIDFKILTISINKDETPELALKKKRNYMKGVKRQIPDEAWLWMTGDSANIAGLTDAVGFNFERTGDDFAHPAALIMLSPKRKIARYLYGITFNQFDLKMAIIEASEGRVGPTIAKVIQFCFSYDPEGRKYVFNFLKVAASAIILFMVVFVTVISLKTTKKRKKEEVA
jgi:protein SCO1/2